MSKSVVEHVRKLYGDRFSGPRRAHYIVNHVAWELREEGAGTFFKSAGTRFNDRSLDVIIFKNGKTYDVLKDAEGKAEPTWGPTRPTGMGDPAKWRAPVHPNELVPGIITPDQPEPEPEPGPTPQPGNGGVVLDLAALVQILTHHIDLKVAELKVLLEAERQVSISTSFGDITGTISGPQSPRASSDKSDP
jgi:hypothetical protein